MIRSPENKGFKALVSVTNFSNVVALDVIALL